jgi:hypothetical protein
MAISGVRHDGLMHARPEITQAMFQGLPIAPDDHYLRMAAFFETSSEQGAWINKILAVGYAKVALPKIELFLYAVRQRSPAALPASRRSDR